jgi:hypothetical protein
MKKRERCREGRMKMRDEREGKGRERGRDNNGLTLTTF